MRRKPKKQPRTDVRQHSSQNHKPNPQSTADRNEKSKSRTGSIVVGEIFVRNESED